MENIGFNKIHKVVIDYLEEKDNNELKIIGSWYHRFLESDKDKLSLQLPFFSEEILLLSFRYIRAYTFIFNLLKGEELNSFDGKCLFDIFNESSGANMDELILEYIKQNGDLALWGEDTLTKLDIFLPVFKKDDLVQFNKTETIISAFKLFKLIRDSRLINFPILIELDEKLLTFNNFKYTFKEFVSEKLICLENILEDEEAESLEDDLLEKRIQNSLLIKYPYSKKPHPWLANIGNKRFNLIFNNRFAYQDISENDIFLLKDETDFSSKIKFAIVDTNHSPKLYDLFKDIREQWVNMPLNKYKYPFPKYWFLFINNSLTQEEWLLQFKKDYPAVAEKPINLTIGMIIKELIDLNWIGKEITKWKKIYFPELKGSRKRTLEFVFNNFKNHVNAIKPDVEFVDDVNCRNCNEVIILDSFNIIDLVNLNQCDRENPINITVPDFLYFGYQPWIKYHLFNFQFLPLLDGLRCELDDRCTNNKEKIQELKTELIREIKSDIKAYENKYKKQIIEGVEEEKPNLEDLEFSNVEEIETTNLEIDHGTVKKNIIINENLANELIISSEEKLLIQKDSLVYTKAINLKIGDLFIRDSEIYNLFDSEITIDKFVNIPESVLTFQSELKARTNVYRVLKSKGISYQTPKYFKDTYLIDVNEDSQFIIPRRKKDWAIICEFLNISYSNQELSFIAYYGRKQKNELKRVIKLIIHLIMEKGWMGSIDDPNMITAVSEIIRKHDNLFQNNNEVNIHEVSESIIATILNQLTLNEVQTIKILTNE